MRNVPVRKSVAFLLLPAQSDVPMYVCQEWIDEVLIVISEDLPYPDGLVDKLTETGVTVHLNLAKITNQTGKRQFVEKVGELYSSDHKSELCILSDSLLLKRHDGYLRRTGGLYFQQESLPSLCGSRHLHGIPRPDFLLPGTCGKERKEIQNVQIPQHVHGCGSAESRAYEREQTG